MRNPRANAGFHSIPLGQEPRSGASRNLASRNKHAIAKWPFCRRHAVRFFAFMHMSCVIPENFTESPKFSRPRGRPLVLMRGGWQAQAPLAVTFRFHVPVGDWNA